MADLWIGGPEARDPALLRPLDAERARVQAHARVLTQGDVSACRLCDSRKRLTEEHTPSKKAGNPARLVREVMNEAATILSGNVIWRAERLQGGARGATLCKSCNNTTGRLYNPAYIRLFERCGPFAIPENAGSVCDVPLDLHPQRAAKQALLHLVTTSQPGITARHPEVRELLLAAEVARPLPPPLRLWLYLRANSGGRVSGVATGITIETGLGRVFAEFSFWPLGWLLTFDDTPVNGALDVSSWLEVAYHEQRQFSCAVPCQWALEAAPGDFRSPETILLEYARRSR